MPNVYFNPTGNPGNRSAGASSVIRSEFAAIGAAFDKLPAINGSKGFTEAFTLEWTPAAGSKQPARMIDIPAFSGAPLSSPAFVGNPTAPTPPPGDNDTSIATTAFVQAAVSPVAASAASAASAAAAASTAASSAQTTANTASTAATAAQVTANAASAAVAGKLSKNQNETTTGTLTIVASAAGSNVGLSATGNAGANGVVGNGGSGGAGVVGIGGSNNWGVYGRPTTASYAGVVGETQAGGIFGALGSGNFWTLTGNGPAQATWFSPSTGSSASNTGYRLADTVTDLGSLFARAVTSSTLNASLSNGVLTVNLPVIHGAPYSGPWTGWSMDIYGRITSITAGKCVAPDTLILMGDQTSAKRIADIVPGDTVWSERGAARVLAVVPATLGTRRLFRIAGEVEITGDHIVLTQRGAAVIDPDQRLAVERACPIHRIRVGDDIVEVITPQCSGRLMREDRSLAAPIGSVELVTGARPAMALFTLLLEEAQFMQTPSGIGLEALAGAQRRLAERARMARFADLAIQQSWDAVPVRGEG